jgi:hypothetical protein
VRREGADPQKTRAVADFLWWAIHYGQGHAPGLAYATLPPEVVARAADRIALLESDGKPVILVGQR